MLAGVRGRGLPGAGRVGECQSCELFKLRVFLALRLLHAEGSQP